MTRFNKIFLIVSIISAIIMSMFSMTMFVNAKEVDTTAPTISISDMTVRTYIGSVPELNVTAQDNVDETVTIDYLWSNEAIDEVGALKEGTHTCTITATDLAKNKSTVIVTFIVVEDISDVTGYAFITIICDGLETVVKAYELNSAIDMSAYADKEGFTKYVKRADGSVVTDFTAKEDMVIYVSYEEIQSDTGDDDQNIDQSDKNGNQNIEKNEQNNNLLPVLIAISGGLTVIFIISGIIVIIRRKQKGGK